MNTWRKNNDKSWSRRICEDPKYQRFINKLVEFDSGTYRIRARRTRAQLALNLGYAILETGSNDAQGGTFTNSEDPDETPQNAASHQGLRCLPLVFVLIKRGNGQKPTGTKAH